MVTMDSLRTKELIFQKVICAIFPGMGPYYWIPKTIPKRTIDHLSYHSSYSLKRLVAVVVAAADVVRDSGGVKERGGKMTRKKKSEMAPPPNVKRTMSLLLLGLIAVLHFANCESVTVVDNEGKKRMSRSERPFTMCWCISRRHFATRVLFACRTNKITQIWRIRRMSSWSNQTDIHLPEGDFTPFYFLDRRFSF